MAYVNVDIDIDIELDEFGLNEILDEIKYRYNKGGIIGNSNKITIDAFLKTMKIDEEDVLKTSSFSLIDQMKVDFLVRNVSKIKLQDLESLI